MHVSAKKLQAFQMRLGGNPYSQISVSTGWSEFTLRHYFSPKGKWFSEYSKWSKKETEDIDIELKAYLLSTAKEAVLKLGELMRGDNPSVALRASQDILDRVGVSIVKDYTSNTTDADDRAEEMLRWFENKNKEKKYEDDKCPCSREKWNKK